jgi:hypothetical protein
MFSVLTLETRKESLLTGTQICGILERYVHLFVVRTAKKSSFTAFLFAFVVQGLDGFDLQPVHLLQKPFQFYLIYVWSCSKAKISQEARFIVESLLLGGQREQFQGEIGQKRWKSPPAHSAEG